MQLQGLTLLIDSIHSEARLERVGEFSNINPLSFSFHTHTAYEVYFVEKGDMTVLLNEESVYLKERDVFVISPGVTHRVKEASEDIRKFNLRFLFRTPPSVPNEKPFWLYETDFDYREELFQNLSWIHHYMCSPQRDPEFLHIKAYLGMIVEDLAKSIFPEGKRSKTKFLMSSEQNRLDLTIVIDDYFKDHFHEKITVSHLAKELNYSPTHINRLLRQYWGLTFGEKLQEVRLQEAQRLLTETSEPVSAIAESCGYSTLRGFEVFFQKRTELLPGKYRQLYRKK